MIWICMLIFGFLGAILGGAISPDLIWLTSLIGGVIGLAIGGVLKAIVDASRKPAADQLAQRVARLEQEVAALRAMIVPVEPPQPAVVEAVLGEATPSEAAPAVIAAPMPAPQSEPPPVPPPAPPPAVTPRPIPAAPRPPTRFETGIAAARAWLLGGNLVARVGILTLFIGVALLLKFSADRGLVPIEYRLAGAALGAIALLGIGWRTRARNDVFGLILQGGGIAVLYLDVLAATRLYPLLPASLAFPLLVVICALAALLAVLQDAPVLAVIGSAGGFLAPILLSTGGGSQVALFSYYAILDLGIFAIAWFKAWRPLNLLGFLFTFTIGTAWGVLSYQPDQLASTEPFLILFFLLYLGIALLYACRQGVALKHYVDGTLVFGTPILAMALQTGLVREIPYALAYTAVGMAAIYLAIALVLVRYLATLRLLFETMLALGIVFATLAIPLGFDGRITGAMWAIEAAGLVWVALRQDRTLALASGLCLQAAAGFGFFVHMTLSGPLAAHTGDLILLNSLTVGAVLVAAAGLFSGWRLHVHAEGRPYAPVLSRLLGIWGLLWWLGAGVREISLHLVVIHQQAPLTWLAAILLFLTVSAGLLHGLSLRLRWPLPDLFALALAPAGFLLTVFGISLQLGPLLAGLGLLAWPLAIAAAYLLLRRLEARLPRLWLAPCHTLLVWTLAILVASEAYWRLGSVVPEGTWAWSAWAYGYGGFLILLATIGPRLAWPIGRFPIAYQLGGGGPVAAMLLLWSLASLSLDGNAAPLPYVPLLNPLDIAFALAMLAIVLWLRGIAAIGYGFATGVRGYIALGIGGFLWVSIILLRGIHHWTGVAYQPDALFHDTVVQASLSIFWTVLALAAMVFATVRHYRLLWLTGACLLGATMIKLFLFDLSHLSGIARIIAFIGIGALMLVIGYVSPLPPKPSVQPEVKS